MANYSFNNPDGIYFVTFAVVDWVDVFTHWIEVANFNLTGEIYKK